MKQILVLIVLSWSLVASAAASKTAVPPKLAPIIDKAQTALQEDKPAVCLDMLETWSGDAHALVELLRGHALFQQKKFPEAKEAYTKARRLDPEMKSAAIGVARVHVETKEYADAAAILGQVLDTSTCEQNELKLYAHVAYENGDQRLASLLVQRGITRFPKDTALRKLDLALLIDDGRSADARSAAQSLLRANPADPILWRHLAAASQEEADPAFRLATLEAALLASPNDPNVFKRHLVEQMNAGHHHEALTRAKAKLSQSKKVDGTVLEVAARAAEAAGQLELARAWLKRIPQVERRRAVPLLEARIALAMNDAKGARQALQSLIDQGESSASIFLWAGQVAEQMGNHADAEVQYRQAMGLEGERARLATLYLAKLLARIQQRERATHILASYLAKHPSDTSARALLATLSSGSP
ncbi:MAG: tetratricopeptide repeat protein [Myxococcota bacterium]|nr:tetratricopeptide repeat protein [Myxococcota bacterium]